MNNQPLNSAGADTDPCHADAMVKLSRDAINALPIQAYAGPRKIIKTESQLKTALAALRRETTLGFDTETRPAFRKGESYPPALLQLGTSSAVYIFILRKTGLPEDLAAILSDPGIIKAGVAVSGDIRTLKAIQPFNSDGFVDLGTVAKRNGIPHHGLRGLAALLLGFRISKSERFTNWDKDPIPTRSLIYAATDAWVSRELYHVMLARGCRDMTPGPGEIKPRPHRPRRPSPLSRTAWNEGIVL